MAVVLIIDDRPVNRDYLVTLLGYGGHQIFEASDGAEALEIAIRERPHLVITDLRMPVMDGLEFTLRLRKEPRFATTPVIFYTATFLQAEARLMASTCGVTQVLMKPCGPQEILAAVAECLGTEIFEPPDEVSARLQQENHQALADQPIALKLADLIDLTERIAREPNPFVLLEKFCQGARYILGSKFAATLIVGRDVPIVSRGSESLSSAVTVNVETPGNLLGRVLAERKVVRLRDLLEPPSRLGLGTDEAGVGSFLGAPIMVAEHVYGLLYFAAKYSGPEFDKRDESMARTMATQLAVAYHNATLLASVKDAEAKYRSLVEQMPATTFVADVDDPWTMLYVSPQIETMLGFPGSDWMKGPARWLSQVHPEDRARLDVELGRSRGVGERLHEEYRLLSKDGRTLWVEQQALVTEEIAGQRLFKGFLVDITDKKVAELGLRESEAQLAQSQKMELVGQLAAGLAHDYNNSLNIIVGYSELLLVGLDAKDPRRAMVELIHGAGLRSTQLTDQLLGFSRKHALAPRVFDLNVLLSTTVGPLIHRLIGEHIQVAMDLQPGLGWVEADSGQIEQVVLNLAVNARDSMSKGGTLTVGTANDRVHARKRTDHGDIPPGDYVVLSVTDTGCGMTPQVKTRMFEPFFTTKPEGKGTGLGLASVLGIVERSGGKIDVASSPGRGTCFKVYLTRVETPALVDQRAPGVTKVGGSS